MSISPSAKVWVYQSDRALNENEWQTVNQHLDTFVQDWNAHGNGLKASFEIVAPFHFSLIVDESHVAASGCSIDSSVKAVKAIQEAIDCDFFQRQNIVVIEGDEKKIYPMQHLVTKVRQNELAPTTLMADTLVNTYEDWQNNFFKPMVDSWLRGRM